MPKLLKARPAENQQEEETVRKLAQSRMAPRAVVERAQMIVASWEGQRTATIAEQIGCHPQTVREGLHRFNELSVDGLQDRPRPGRPRRITESECSAVVALVVTTPPGRLRREEDGVLAVDDAAAPAHWTLDALAAVAQQRSIAIQRSQVRRILLAEGVRWRTVRSWATSNDPEFEKNALRLSNSTRNRP